jgi:hypothetical protein
MAFFVGALGVLQLLAGGMMFLVARSAMHETTSATLVGLGVLALGAAALINRVDELINEAKKAALDRQAGAAR